MTEPTNTGLDALRARQPKQIPPAKKPKRRPPYRRDSDLLAVAEACKIVDHTQPDREQARKDKLTILLLSLAFITICVIAGIWVDSQGGLLWAL